MEKSALLPNFILTFLLLYFGIVIEGENKFSLRQWIYIILLILDISFLIYVNRESVLSYLYPKMLNNKITGRKFDDDEVKDYIE
jgi:hypothetical protein